MAQIERVFQGGVVEKGAGTSKKNKVFREIVAWIYALLPTLVS